MSRTHHDARRRGLGVREALRLVAVVTLPLALFALHGSFFSSWEIDDAGISYAYARNLAAGEGLVAQSGSEPVEGFTNLLWVGLLAALLPVMHTPGLAARALAYGLVAASFLTLALGLRAWFPRRWRLVAAVGLSTTALVTGFAAWTLSGLENGLYACLVAVFLVLTTQARDSPRDGAALGGVWILLIATRPEAAPLIVVPAIVWAVHHTRRSRAPLALTAATGLFALTAFRVLYFGDVVPNTYYAKGGPGWKLLAGVSWTPAKGLLFGLLGALALLAVVRFTGSAAGRLRWLRERSPQQLGFLAVWLTLFICYLVFETLPADWMPEGRFATPLFLLGPLALLGLVRRRAVLLGAMSLALLAGAGGYSLIHTPAFASSPPAPFASVVERSRQLARLGDLLSPTTAPTILLPDIGGALWLDRFVVMDLAGLIDRRIARTLKARDREGFYDYVFETRRPELIWSHGFWRTVSDLEADARLARDYELLFEDDLHILYVRSEAARGIEGARLLEALSSVPRADDAG